MEKPPFRLAIVTTHPIQYNAPWFRLLSLDGRVRPMVFYTWSQSASGDKFDPDFGKSIKWDIPLLEGYEYQFVKNVARDPGSHRFNGIVNPGLVKAIEEWRPDAVLVFGWNFRSHLQCLRHFHGKIPVLFRGDSTLLNETRGLRTRLRRAFLTWVYRHVDYALYVGSRNREYFSVHGMKDGQLVFAPHAIDNQRFADDDPTRTAEARQWRRILDVRDDDLVLLFAGKLEPRKDPFYLLQLAKAIGDSRLKIILVGNGVLEDALKSAAAADARILFLDFQNQQKMPVVYRLGDIFVLPSCSETWGLGINEAMACGKPIISTDRVGCVVDLVEDGRNGLVFNIANDQIVISFLKKLVENRDQLTTMGQRSKEIIAGYSFGAIVDSICSLANSIKKN